MAAKRSWIAIFNQSSGRALINRTRHYSVFAAVAALFFLAPAACTSKGRGSAPVVSAPSPVKALEAYGSLQNDFAVLVDVREEDEVKEGMAAPAQWFPLSRLEANPTAWDAFAAKLPQNKQIIFYCASGSRAGKAAQMLSQKGFRTAIMGGFEAWTKAGLPVKKP